MIMSKFVDPNNSNLHPGDNVRNYLVKRVVPLEGIRSFFYELEHLKTGAHHIHVSNKDPTSIQFAILSFRCSKEV
jgi:Zn-dependent M16 (insulinase) family peptidase